MALWRPGARPTSSAPSLIPTPPAAAAGRRRTGSSSVRATLIHLARRIQARSDMRAWHEVQDIDDWEDRDAITIAGLSAPATEEPAELDEAARRDGWLKILAQAWQPGHPVRQCCPGERRWP